jgi:primosomal protein N' (replication factor Y) (superfamily II helicase)
VPLIDVALSLPLFRTFSYRVPEGLTGSVAPGSRVLVPFRNKREIGLVLGPAEPREGVKYKDVLAAPDDAPCIDAPMLVLCKWIAEYYLVPLGVALRCALPAALTGAGAPVPARKTRRVL